MVLDPGDLRAMAAIAGPAIADEDVEAVARGLSAQQALVAALDAWNLSDADSAWQHAFDPTWPDDKEQDANGC